MDNIFEFENREEFHNWLSSNSEKSDDIWLLFGKKGGPKTFSANETLKEV